MSVITPTSLVGARSPIYVTAPYSALAGSLTDVTFEVYIWNGSRSSRPASPVYTLFRDVFAGKDVSFDIAPMVQEYLSNSYSGFDATSVSYAPNGSVVWIQIDYVVNYINKANPPQTINDTGSSDIFEASNGYHIFIEAANKEVNKGFASINAQKYIKDSGNEVVPVYLGKWGEGYDIYWAYKDRVLADGGTIEGGSACANIGLYKVEVITDTLYNVDFIITEAQLQGLQAEERIMLLPCGVTNLTAWLASLGEPLNFTKYYDILLKDKDGTILDSRRFYPTCESKFTPSVMQFINKNGVWESITFFKRSESTVNTSTSEYRRSLGSSSATGFSYDTTAHNYKRINTNGRKNFILNTGWVGEDYDAIMEQMLMSERVMLDGLPVNVTTSSMTLQKVVNDKTINYTIEVEEAFDTRYV
tara:strand:- start:143 stop:1393 length:1251 start_codon:yes stop_codon:yes gene_type:complete